MQLNAKQIDAAGFLAKVLGDPAAACAQMACQLTDEECGKLFAVRDPLRPAVQKVLDEAAERREKAEAVKLALEEAKAEQAAAEAAEEKAAAKKLAIEELQAMALKTEAAETKAAETNAADAETKEIIPETPVTPAPPEPVKTEPVPASP
jgi:membrane protein involved in colicin uptake